MRFLRKQLYSQSLLKLARLFIVLAVCTVGILGLKLIIAPEATSVNSSNTITNNNNNNAADNSIHLQDFRRRPTSSSVEEEAEEDLNAFPGWVAEKQLNPKSQALSGKLPENAAIRQVKMQPRPFKTSYIDSREKLGLEALNLGMAQATMRNFPNINAPPIHQFFEPIPIPLQPENMPSQQLGNFAVGPNQVINQNQNQNWQLPPGIQVATLPPRITIRERLVHFDLKGAPPLISYYKDIFPLLKKLGATGVLMEYEDMFPFTGRLKVVNARNGYSRDDIAVILRLAKENGLYVIPLVQTFGHLEFVLKHKEFVGLREVEKFPQAVCPTRNGTFLLVDELITQTLLLHPDAEYLHIGADEVFHLGLCPVCSKIVTEDLANGKKKLFLSYLAQLLSHIRQKFPTIKPIMWDDMFHTMSSLEIKTGLGDLVNYVEPMIWSYYPTWINHLPNMGDLYQDLFQNIWGATAFKGSAGETQQIPNIKTQSVIHTSWLEALRNNGHKMKNFRGIVLTGWSRYDHFYSLCELFPVSIPSLAINLQILIDGEMNLPGMQLASKNLNCQSEPSTLEFINFDPNLEQFSNCKFPGVEIFRIVHTVTTMTAVIKPFLEELEGKFPEYQSKSGYLQSSKIEEQMLKITNFEAMLMQYIHQANSAFVIVFDEFTLREWEAAYLFPVLNKLLKWKEVFRNASEIDSYPSRPLMDLPTLLMPNPQLLQTADPFVAQVKRNPFVPVRGQELARGQLFF